MNAKSSFFTDIRKTALLMFATGLPLLLITAWNTYQALAALPSTSAILVLALAIPFGGIMPVFYFALYRNTTRLGFPRHIKTMSIITAFVFGFLVAIDLWRWISYVFFPTLQSSASDVSVLSAHTGPWTRLHLSAVLSILSSTAYVIMLLALARQPDDEPPETHAPVSRFLAIATKVALIAYGAWVAFNIVRLGLTPNTYHVLSARAHQIGQPPPPFRPLLTNAIRTLISQACLFIAPYVVNSRLREDDARGRSGTQGNQIPGKLDFSEETTE